jgi:HK97 family phage major capsid protein
VGRQIDVDAFAQAHQRAYDELTGRTAPGLPLHQGAGQARDHRSPGQVFTESEAYKRWMAAYPDGAPSRGAQTSEPVTVRAPAIGGMRALVTSASASAGSLVAPDHRGLMEPGLVRPLTVRQLVTTIPTSSDLVQYVREVARVSAAAPTPEATQVPHEGDEDATKPEGGITFELVEDRVRTIPEWVPATKRILSDAPALRAYIDSYLTDDLGVELEDQMVAGDGLGENFLGILNDGGIQGVGTAGDGLNALDRIRRAKRLVRTGGRTTATAVLLNPEDAELVDTLKAEGDGHYFRPGGPYGSGDLPRVWGIPQVESEALPPGTALVGDFRRAALWDREATTISVGTVGDDFIRNIVRVLGELRAGFGVIRPAAFVAVDLAAAA